MGRGECLEGDGRGGLPVARCSRPVDQRHGRPGGEVVKPVGQTTLGSRELGRYELDQLVRRHWGAGRYELDQLVRRRWGGPELAGRPVGQKTLGSRELGIVSGRAVKALREVGMLEVMAGRGQAGGGTQAVTGAGTGRGGGNAG